jgi:hypothetical protein
MVDEVMLYYDRQVFSFFLSFFLLFPSFFLSSLSFFLSFFLFLTFALSLSPFRAELLLHDAQVFHSLFESANEGQKHFQELINFVKTLDPTVAKQLKPVVAYVVNWFFTLSDQIDAIGTTQIL